MLFRLSTFSTFQNHWEGHQVGWKGTRECCSDFPLSPLSKTIGRVIKLGGKVPGSAVQTFHFLHFPKPLGGSSSWVERYQGMLFRLSTFSTFQNHWEGHQVGWKGTRECCSDFPLSPLSKTIGRVIKLGGKVPGSAVQTVHFLQLFQNHWEGHQVGWKGTRECCSDFPLSPLSKTIGRVIKLGGKVPGSAVQTFHFLHFPKPLGGSSSWVERYQGVLFRLSTFSTFQNHWEGHQVGWKGTRECCSDFPLSPLSKTIGRVIKLGGKVPGSAVQTFHFLHFSKPLGGSSSWVEMVPGSGSQDLLSTFSTVQNHWEGHQVGWKEYQGVEVKACCPLSPLSKTIGRVIKLGGNEYQGLEVKTCPLSHFPKPLGGSSSWVERVPGSGSSRPFHFLHFPKPLGGSSSWVEMSTREWKSRPAPLSPLSKTIGRVIKLGGKVPGSAVQTFHFLHFPKPLGGSSSWVEMSTREWKFKAFPLSPLSKTIGRVIKLGGKSTREC